MEYNQFKGLGVAMVTPFNQERKIDFPALQRLTENLLKGGVDYLVVQGTTGESPTLSEDEKRSILDFVLEINNGELPIVYGIGGNDTQGIINTFKTWDFDGIDGILSVSPYYSKPTQQGLYEHYRALNENTPLPILLYNVPGRTGKNVEAETTVKIARECKNIVGVKEASGNMEQIMKIIAQSPDGFLVISGDDAITLPILAAGGDGVISVIANAFPKDFSNLVKCAMNKNTSMAREIHFDLINLIQAIFVEGNPAGIKEVLKIKGICDNYLRLPLTNVSKELSQRLYTLMAESNLVLL